MGHPRQKFPRSNRTSRVEAFSSALRVGQCAQADVALHALRVAATGIWASQADREALTTALRQAAPLATPQCRESLVHELADWAGREGASPRVVSDYATARAEHRRDAADDGLSDGHSFDELEAVLCTAQLPRVRWLAAMAQLRRLAELAGAGEAGPLAPRRRFAQRWLTAAPAQGSVAQLDPDGLENDRKAYLWSLPAAHRGDAAAQLLLGHCYRSGRGVARCNERAVGWYQQAATGGSCDAAFWLNYGDLEQDRVSLSRSRAAAWFGATLLAVYMFADLGDLHPAVTLAYVLVVALAYLSSRCSTPYTGGCDA